MATASKIERIENVLQIDPNDIDTSQCIGLHFPEWSEALGTLMVSDGQRQPIGVKPNGPRAAKSWTLTFGFHRVEGALAKNMPFVRAIIDDDGGEASQASENIDRRKLGPIEHALFVRCIADAAEARLKDQHGDLSPQEIGVRKRWDAVKAKATGVERDENLTDAEADHTRLNLSRVYGWREDVAETLGLSLAALKRHLSLHRAIIAPFPGLYDALARHPIVGENASALRDIAAIKDMANRRALIEALVEAPDLTLAAAMEGLGLSQPASAPATGATKFMNGTTANLARLSAGDQARIAPEIVKTMKRSALLALRAALDARIEQEGIGNA